MPTPKKQPEDEVTAVAYDIKWAKQQLSARIDAALSHGKTHRRARKLKTSNPQEADLCSVANTYPSRCRSA